MDLRLFEESGDTAAELGHDFLLARQHPRQIQSRWFDLDAVAGEVVASLGQQFAGVEERLARDAAFVETNPAEGGAALDHRHLLAELGGAQGGNVAAGAGADNDQVEEVGIHRGLLRLTTKELS